MKPQQLNHRLKDCSSSQPRYFASLWSLRGYPHPPREWTWKRKFRAVREAGFDGIMSPARPELRQRGELQYLAITSLRRREEVEPAILAAAELNAVGIVVQLGTPTMGANSALKLARLLDRTAGKHALSWSVETHRATWLETPEKIWELADRFAGATGRSLPLCFDFSHPALVRHITAPLWPALAERPAAIAAAPVFHLRPFNAHHAQLPVTAGRRGRTPEYLEWKVFAAALLQFLREHNSSPILVPELGHLSPAYRLSSYPDTWRDTRATLSDLKALWRSPADTRQV